MRFTKSFSLFISISISLPISAMITEKMLEDCKKNDDIKVIETSDIDKSYEIIVNSNAKSNRAITVYGEKIHVNAINFPELASRNRVSDLKKIRFDAKEIVWDMNVGFTGTELELVAEAVTFTPNGSIKFEDDVQDKNKSLSIISNYLDLTNSKFTPFNFITRNWNKVLKGKNDTSSERTYVKIRAKKLSLPHFRPDLNAVPAKYAIQQLSGDSLHPIGDYTMLFGNTGNTIENNNKNYDVMIGTDKVNDFIQNELVGLLWPIQLIKNWERKFSMGFGKTNLLKEMKVFEQNLAFYSDYTKIRFTKLKDSISKNIDSFGLAKNSVLSGKFDKVNKVYQKNIQTNLRYLKKWINKVEKAEEGAKSIDISREYSLKVSNRNKLNLETNTIIDSISSEIEELSSAKQALDQAQLKLDQKNMILKNDYDHMLREQERAAEHAKYAEGAIVLSSFFTGGASTVLYSAGVVGKLDAANRRGGMSGLDALEIIEESEKKKEAYQKRVQGLKKQVCEVKFRTDNLDGKVDRSKYECIDKIIAKKAEALFEAQGDEKEKTLEEITQEVEKSYASNKRPLSRIREFADDVQKAEKGLEEFEEEYKKNSQSELVDIELESFKAKDEEYLEIKKSYEAALSEYQAINNRLNEKQLKVQALKTSILENELEILTLNEVGNLNGRERIKQLKAYKEVAYFYYNRIIKNVIELKNSYEYFSQRRAKMPDYFEKNLLSFIMTSKDVEFFDNLDYRTISGVLKNSVESLEKSLNETLDLISSEAETFMISGEGNSNDSSNQALKDIKRLTLKSNIKSRTKSAFIKQVNYLIRESFRTGKRSVYLPIPIKLLERNNLLRVPRFLGSDLKLKLVDPDSIENSSFKLRIWHPGIGIANDINRNQCRVITMTDDRNKLRLDSQSFDIDSYSIDSYASKDLNIGGGLREKGPYPLHTTYYLSVDHTDYWGDKDDLSDIPQLKNLDIHLFYQE